MMHAGKVLAQGPPAELVAERRRTDLEEAFIGYLEDAADRTRRRRAAPETTQRRRPYRRNRHLGERTFSLGRVWAFARREAIELQHDTVRLAFAMLGPIVLMIVFGYGISLDVDHLAVRRAGLRRNACQPRLCR